MFTRTAPGQVSQLNIAARNLLEENFHDVWIEGELSNIANPASGHLYFSLKDSTSQVRCAMFRGQNRLLCFQPESGQQVLIKARVSLYPARGDYQLIVEQMEESGEGALRRAFEKLKQKLDNEGLFDTRFKKPLPSLPERIGVVTSASGAAIQDIIQVLNQRFPSIPVRVFPASVQGALAVNELVKSIQLCDKAGDCDVLIIARGGGSLEDLQAFNDEKVARAVFSCSIPVVSGVGHEVDITIADLVADLRAPTPSAAAEAVSPDQHDYRHRLNIGFARLKQAIQGNYEQNQQKLQLLKTQLKHPGTRLQEVSQRVDMLNMQLNHLILNKIQQQKSQYISLLNQLQSFHPASRLKMAQLTVNTLKEKLLNLIEQQQQLRKQQFLNQIRSLNTVSPLATLDRGYAIVTDKNGSVIQDASDIKTGEQIVTRIAKGRLKSTVDEIDVF